MIKDLAKLITDTQERTEKLKFLIKQLENDILKIRALITNATSEASKSGNSS